MKKIFLSIFAAAIFITAAAQKNNTYPVVISFNSICCGVPGNEPVLKFISTFKKQNRIRSISVDRIGPMGREGEYYMAFHLKELNKKQKATFIQQLKKIAPTMKERGSAEIKEDVEIMKDDMGRREITTTKL